LTDTHSLTELQLAILHILWKCGEATTQEVHSAMTEVRGLALTTVATLLSRLEKKGILSHRQEGRQYVYRPLVTEKEVRHSKVRELTANLFEGDPSALVRHLLRAHEVDRDELERLVDMIEEADRDGG
jgi:BlaI family transcriptional regulator, penicillinase repressor